MKYKKLTKEQLKEYENKKLTTKKYNRNGTTRF